MGTIRLISQCSVVGFQHCRHEVVWLRGLRFGDGTRVCGLWSCDSAGVIGLRRCEGVWLCGLWSCEGVWVCGLRSYEGGDGWRSREWREVGVWRLQICLMLAVPGTSVLKPHLSKEKEMKVRNRQLMILSSKITCFLVYILSNAYVYR